MKIQTMTALMVFAVASFVSTAQGQRPPRPSHPPAPQPPSQFQRRLDPPRLPSGHDVPSSSILPMTNPIAPIVTSPIQPFIRYGPIPEVVFPTRAPARPSRPDYGRRGYNDPTVIVGGGYYWGFPGYYYPYPYTPAPIPGELPYTYPYVPAVAGQLPYTIPVGEPAPEAVVAAPSAPAAPVYQPEVVEYVPEQNMIITPPVPDRTATPPAIGTSKADVLARYGEPWGTVRIQGKESLYFRGGLELVFENDVLIQVK